jgi:hypothetical protein
VASAGEGAWDDILADLTAMVTAFLTSPVVMRPARKSRELEA